MHSDEDFERTLELLDEDTGSKEQVRPRFDLVKL